jgi:hypothetical protein
VLKKFPNLREFESNFARKLTTNEVNAMATTRVKVFGQSSLIAGVCRVPHHIFTNVEELHLKCCGGYAACLSSCARSDLPRFANLERLTITILASAWDEPDANGLTQFIRPLKVVCRNLPAHLSSVESLNIVERDLSNHPFPKASDLPDNFATAGQLFKDQTAALLALPSCISRINYFGHVIRDAHLPSLRNVGGVEN